MKKTKLCIICGGQSTEHQVSLVSGNSVLNAVPKDKYDVFVITIDKTGQWLFFPDGKFMAHADNPDQAAIAEGGLSCYLGKYNQGAAIFIQSSHDVIPIDVVFPVLHGAFGEDGTIQGLFEMLNLPYVGSDVLGSSCCMDKAVCKVLLNSEGLQTAKAIILRSPKDLNCKEAVSSLGNTIFVKPANAGSSVGISKTRTEAELKTAVAEAFKFDNKVLLEEAIAGREIECAVLGNGSDLVCAPPGEVIPHCEFYSYEAKYISADGATVNVKASLSAEETATVQSLAKRAYIAAGCAGMSRVDFFLSKDRGWIVNEINTIPGFTSISLYPQMMGQQGIKYPELIEKLIDLALDKHNNKIKLLANLNFR